MQLKSLNRNSKAFTLIELLVVVAIIALLLSILLPSLERARAQARKIICLTNLQSQGKGVFFYAEENDGWIPRGIVGFGGKEYGIYATSIIKYLGYDGYPFSLWDGGSQDRPDRNDQRKVRRALGAAGEMFQCPDYPDDAHTVDYGTGLLGPPLVTSPLDYVSSVMPIPYTKEQAGFDRLSAANGENVFREEGGTPDYPGVSKLDDVALATSPSRLIMATESHTSLRWDDLSFHTFFLTSQLPFGNAPRIANDERHPGGIDALFFDGHASVLALQKMDPGWPNDIDLRLLLFSPLGYTP